ncbi:MAG: S8 family serine peptidase [Actinomycetota bacterium]
MHARKIAGGLAILVDGALARPATAAPNDPYFSRQWGLVKVQAEQAWTVTTGNAALIAIVDSGVDLTHPDLDGNIVSYPDADLVEPEGNCSNKKGIKSCTQDGAQDENGHGTHVAGIAAAETGNGLGVAGVAPGAKILPVRVLDADGAGTTQRVADGIKFAADRGALVVNLSLGYDATGHVSKLLGNLRPVYGAIDYAVGKGAVVVVAAGNGPLGELSGPGVPLCAEPAQHPGVLCVGAVDQRDAPSWFGNFDATTTGSYLVAPGGEGGDTLTCAGDIFSTYLRSAGAPSCSPEQGYEALAGTSMAAPLVSGVAGLLAGKGLTSQQIIDCLTSTADDLGVPGRDPVYGYGRVNAYRAVTGC